MGDIAVSRFLSFSFFSVSFLPVCMCVALMLFPASAQLRTAVIACKRYKSALLQWLQWRQSAIREKHRQTSAAGRVCSLHQIANAERARGFLRATVSHLPF